MEGGFKGRDLAALGLLALIFGAAFIRWAGMSRDPRTQDELIYTRWAAMLACERSDVPYARYVGREGPGIPYAYLFFEYNSFPMAWNGPSPLRAGYLGLLSAFMGSSGPQDINVGVRLSIAASLLTLAILALAAWHCLGPGPALLFAGLMAVSPLDLLVARRCWMDSVLSLATALLLLSGLWTATGRSPWRFAALFASSLWVLLLKESGFVTVGILGLWTAALSRVRSGAWGGAQASILALLAAAVAAAGILVLLAGGWEPVRDAFAHCFGAVFRASAPTSASGPTVLEFEGIPMVDDPFGALASPWYGPLLGLWALSPLSMILGLAGLGLALRRWREEALLGGWAWFGLLFLLVICVQPKSLRWLAPVDPGLHLLAAWAVWGLRRRLGPWVLAGVALWAASDLWNARRMVEAGVRDPTLTAVKAGSLWLAK